MAHASSKFLNIVSGRIENALPHYAFMRNGKQFVGFVRKGWNTELTTDVQKITALRFAYATAISNMLSAAAKAGTAKNRQYAIGYTYQYVKVGRGLYFYDETLFSAVNDVFASYFSAPKLFVPGTTYKDQLDDDIQLFVVAPAVQKSLDNTGKSAFRYALTSILMENAERVDLPNLYRDLAQVEGAQFDVYPKQDVFEVFGFKQLDLWRWARIPVMDIEPQNYDRLLEHKRDGYDHRSTFAAYIEEQSWPEPVI